jgi:hypothetical protein
MPNFGLARFEVVLDATSELMRWECFRPAAIGLKLRKNKTSRINEFWIWYCPKNKRAVHNHHRPHCYLSFFKSYVPPHWFVEMCHNYLFSCCRSDLVGSPGSCGGRRRWIRRPFRYLNQEKSYFIGNIVRLFLSEGSSWIVNSSSVASRCSPPPEKCTVPTNKSSLKL